MSSSQILKHEVSYHPENVQEKSRTGSDRYLVYLPDTIQRIGLEKGDCVSLTKQEDEAAYILGQKISKQPPCDPEYKIHTSEKPRVSLPSDLITEFIQYGGDERLIVEVNTIENSFRIYKNEDYNKYRVKQLVDEEDTTLVTGKPVVVSLTGFTAGKEAGKTDSGEDDLRSGFGDDINDEDNHRSGFGDDIDDEDPG
jgi:hypothetical protein